MFECKLSSAQLFKNLIDIISTMLSDGELIVTNNGLKLRSLEPTRAALIDLFLSKDVCETYTCDEETRLKINFNDLSKLVGRASGDEAVFLRFLADENKLQVKFKGKSTRTYSIPLLDQVICETMEEGSIPTDVQIELSTSVLSQAIKDAKLIDDLVDFIVQKNGEFVIYAESERGDLRIDFEEKATKYDSENDVVATYSIEFLIKILKAGVISETVTIEFSKNSPIVFKFPIDNDAEKGRIIYFLAPQGETEEEEEEEEDIYDESDEELIDDVEEY